jgi:hypothetical protein
MLALISSHKRVFAPPAAATIRSKWYPRDFIKSMFLLAANATPSITGRYKWAALCSAVRPKNWAREFGFREMIFSIQ